MSKFKKAISIMLSFVMLSTLLFSNVIAVQASTSMEAGHTYNYNFKTLDTNINVGENSTYTTSDGYMDISTNASGKVSYNTGGHGIAINGTNGSAAFSFNVPGNAAISISRCQYTSASALPITASATSGVITASIDNAVSSDGETGTITYKGGAASITITVPAVSYIHEMSVMVEAERLYPGEVWDFGAVAAGDSVSNNMITVSNLAEAFAENNGKQGTLLGKTYSFGDVSYIANANDRFISSTAGLENVTYGKWASSSIAFDDGYTSNGCIYANGSGGAGRRCITVDNCKTGDLVTIYMGVSADTTLHFVNGTDDQTAAATGSGKYSFVCQKAGSYKFYVDTTNNAKPYYYRINRAAVVEVSGVITNPYSDVTTVSAINFKNTETDTVTSASVNADGSYTVYLQPGYSYMASIGNTGYAVNNENNIFNVPYTNESYTSGVTYNTDVITQELVNISGTYPTDTDINITAIKFVPVDATLETISAVLNNGTYSANIISGKEYYIDVTASLDYQLTDNSAVNITETAVRNIDMTAKTAYAVSGNFYSLAAFPENNTAVTGVTEISFRHSDGSVYYADITGNSYSVNLRDGEYTVALDSAHNTVSHVSVNGAAVTKNVYVDDREPVEPAESNTVYVGPTRAYKTINDALEAVSSLATSENNRAYIVVDPGVYREQLNITTPYVTIKSASGNKDVTVTWYYGIDYKYYSLNAKGFYDKALAADKYSKNECVQNWGTTVYVGADGFSAENIVFENSFNRYFTDEEFEDGVELIKTNSTNNAQLERTSDLPDSYARRKDGTKTNNTIERAAAIVIKADNTEYYNCSFLSSQDTVYTGNANQNSYFKNCYIEGMTDYIFSDTGNCVLFEGCQLAWAGYTNSAAGGYITATRGNYLFRNCEILDAPADYEVLQTAGYFGRPWGANAKVIFLNTSITGAGITSTGWNEMSGVQPDAPTVTFKQYGTTWDGEAFDTNASFDKLTEEEYNAISDSDFLGDWIPVHYTAQASFEVNSEETTEVITEQTTEETTEVSSEEITEVTTDADANEMTETETEGNNVEITVNDTDKNNNLNIEDANESSFEEEAEQEETTVCDNSELADVSLD